MPSSIKNYAIDYNGDGKIDPHSSLEDFLSHKLFKKIDDKNLKIKRNYKRNW